MVTAARMEAGKPTMAARRRGRGERPSPVNGWLVVDKPSGVTSTTVCNRVRRLAGNAKTGHGGTLDPLATGVLPIAFGEATKTVGYTMDARKSYRFTVRWGEARDTDDADGEIVETAAGRPGVREIEAALPRFIGEIEQTPPIYSAVKIGGERAYKLAREDRAVVPEPRQVTVESFSLVRQIDDDAAEFDVVCGKGTYMRSLARDLALALGTVGHIAVLRRTAVGGFREADAMTLASLEALGHIPPDFEGLLPVETALADIPALALSGSEAATLRSGQVVQLFRTSDLPRLGEIADGSTVRATAGGKLVAVARLEGGRVRPVRVMNH